MVNRNRSLCVHLCRTHRPKHLLCCPIYTAANAWIREVKEKPFWILIHVAPTQKHADCSSSAPYATYCTACIHHHLSCTLTAIRSRTGRRDSRRAHHGDFCFHGYGGGLQPTDKPKTSLLSCCSWSKNAKLLLAYLPLVVC